MVVVEEPALFQALKAVLDGLVVVAIRGARQRQLHLRLRLPRGVVFEELKAVLKVRDGVLGAL